MGSRDPSPNLISGAQKSQNSKKKASRDVGDSCFFPGSTSPSAFQD